ncbi:MAG: hypothetical protein Q9173_002280 [Seirophora scorigena]
MNSGADGELARAPRAESGAEIEPASSEIYLLTSNGPWQAIFHNREEFVGYAPLVDGSGPVSGARRSHDEPLMRNSNANGAPEGGSPRTSARLREENARTSVEDRLDLRVEKFTLKKLIGVFACFAGVVLTSGADISGDNDKNRGSFPHKSHQQISIGDALALLSAVLYGIYTTLMKKRIGDEARVNMALFFGIVGLFNIITLLPGFVVFHYTGVEPFKLPPTGRICAIILVCGQIKSCKHALTEGVQINSTLTRRLVETDPAKAYYRQDGVAQTRQPKDYLSCNVLAPK